MNEGAAALYFRAHMTFIDLCVANLINEDEHNALEDILEAAMTRTGVQQ